MAPRTDSLLGLLREMSWQVEAVTELGLTPGDIQVQSTDADGVYHVLVHGRCGVLILPSVGTGPGSFGEYAASMFDRLFEIARAANTLARP